MVALFLAASLAGCAPADRPMLSEVFYDAVGDDSGWEFVELLNAGATTRSLAGLRLETGDGSGPGRWTLRWTAAAADSIAPHGRFVIGGARVSPTPNVVLNLEIQNGPDAVRLTWPDGATEVLGWGVHEFTEYFCGAPAVDVPAGTALARIPDLAASGSNALDFRGMPPTPGRANQAARDLAVARGSLRLVPDVPAPGAPFVVRARIANPGTTPLGAAEGALVVEVAADTVVGARASASLDPAPAPGDTVEVTLELPGLAEGDYVVRARTALAGDEAPANDADTLLVRIGAGPLEIVEIQFHPALGEGEWFEIRNRTATSLAPGGWTFADRSGRRGRLAARATTLAPGELGVVAQNLAALRTAFPALDTSRVWPASPWPALNNSDDSTGTADEIDLRDGAGRPCALVAWSARGVAPGASIEWRDGGWWPSLEPGGTPLQPPRIPAPLAGRLELVPRRLGSGHDVVRVGWSLPWSDGRIAVDMYDLDGRRVAVAMPETRVPARGERAWQPAVAPGLYVVVLRARDGSGHALSESRALRVDGW